MGNSSPKPGQSARPRFPKRRICIVGGGMAGLSSAYYLVQKGYDPHHITLIEKEGRVGGKCCTWNDGKAYVDMGAVVFAEYYTHALTLVKELDLEKELELVSDIHIVDRATGKAQSLDKYAMSEAGAGHPVLHFLGLDMASFLLQARTFMAKQEEHAHWIRQAGNHNCPDELGLPAMEFLSMHNMAGLAPLLTPAVTSYGYGTLEEIPAGYVMKYFGKGLFMQLIKLGASIAVEGALEKIGFDIEPPHKPRNLKRGYQSLAEKIEEVLKRRGVKFILDAPVQQVVRRREDVSVFIPSKDPKAAPGSLEEIRCEKLILAATTDKETLSFLDFTEDEKNIFDCVQTHHYASILLREVEVEKKELAKDEDDWSTGARHFLVENGQRSVQTQGCTEINTPVPNQPFRLGYVWDKANTMTLADMVESMREQAAKLGHQMEKEPVYVREWKYFPHFSSADFIEKNNLLSAIQGQHCTYFAGGVMHLEAVEDVLSFSHYLVQHYF